jgi:molecular chaperone DnaK
VAYVPRNGDMIVGKDALRYGLADPFGMVSSVKRVLGIPWGDPSLRALDAGVGYKLVQGPNQHVLLRVNGVDVTAAQIVAAVLSRLKKLAEQRFGGTCRRAVFTVPAEKPAGYARELTKAAKLAGLEVIEFVPEPVAGVIAHGMQNVGDHNIVVVDFGGGTFDATLMEQHGARFKSRGIGGDPFLGGDDFDHALADAVDGTLARAHKLSMRNDVVRWSQLLYRCESVKRQLSTAAVARLQLRDAYAAGGQRGDLDLAVERVWIEPRWEPLVERAVELTRSLMARAGWDPRTVEDVVMIGGTALIPLVAQRFSQLFGRRVAGSPEATLAVARGAAVLGARHMPSATGIAPQIS